MKVAVVINPISGTGGRPEVARQRVAFARSTIAATPCDAEICISERPRHATELARDAVRRGIRLVVAWGGDGTVNEVASAVAFTGATLAIVPSGSGNGLARELGIPLESRGAFAVALAGADRVIDGGELDGRLFFNIAGVGLDAHVALRFAAGGLVRRGLKRYLQITAHELLTYRPGEHAVAVDGEVQRERALIVAIANARQYGNRAIVAPHARLDDGLLDVVVIRQRPIPLLALQLPWVFAGRIHTVPGVTIRRGAEVEIASAGPMVYHVDGEPFAGGARITGRVRPKALRVRIPQP